MERFAHLSKIEPLRHIVLDRYPERTKRLDVLHISQRFTDSVPLSYGTAAGTLLPRGSLNDT